MTLSCYQRIQKIVIIICLIVFPFHNSYSQSFNEDKTSFVNFVSRMYTASPFEGVKIVEGDDKDVMISVVEGKKSPTERQYCWTFL